MGRDFMKKTLLTPSRHNDVCKTRQLRDIFDWNLSDAGHPSSGNNETKSLPEMPIISLSIQRNQGSNAQILWVILSHLIASGGRLNKKDGLTRYGDSHVKDKTS